MGFFPPQPHSHLKLNNVGQYFSNGNVRVNFLGDLVQMQILIL